MFLGLKNDKYIIKQATSLKLGTEEPSLMGHVLVFVRVGSSFSTTPRVFLIPRRFRLFWSLPRWLRLRLCIVISHRGRSLLDGFSRRLSRRIQLASLSTTHSLSTTPSLSLFSLPLCLSFYPRRLRLSLLWSLLD